MVRTKHPFDRIKICDLVTDPAAPIHPSFCISSRIEEKKASLITQFATKFFSQLSSAEIEELNAFAERDSKGNELIVSFTLNQKGSGMPLTKHQIIAFDFSNYTYQYFYNGDTEDEVREIAQCQCSIRFSRR